MIQTFLQLVRMRTVAIMVIGIGVVGVVTAVSFLARPLVAQEAPQQMRLAPQIAMAGPLSVTTEQSLEFVFSLPMPSQNQPNASAFRLILQDAETGSVFGQKEIQVAGGIPGGGCLDLTVDQGGNVLINGQVTNFHVQPGTRKAVIAILIPLNQSGQVRFVASLQLFDNATNRTIAALSAVQ